jgi:hypothetical protein
MANWRALTSGREISHRLLCRAVVRRHDRRLVRRLIAPYTFSWIAEYPILLALAALCRPPAATSVAALEPLVLAVSRRARVALIAPA